MKLDLPLIFALVSASALGAPAIYNIDPDHTHPSFEVDHFAGLSNWRGSFKKTSGSVELDAAARSGTVDIVVDTASIDFSHDKLNEHASGPEMLDVERRKKTKRGCSN
jgi:polyisoprenoid-binding protein YceI